MLDGIADAALGLKIGNGNGVKDGELGALGFGIAHSMSLASMLVRGDLEKVREDPVEDAALLLASAASNWKAWGRDQYKRLEEDGTEDRSLMVAVTGGRNE